MAGGYDGSIRIDTKVDEKGFNKGIKNIGAGIKGIGTSMKLVGKLLAGLTTAAFGAVLGVHAIAGVIRFIRSAFDALVDLNGYGDVLRVKFEELRLTMITAFQPLITAALPYIIQVVDWMIRLLNVAQMVIATLFGQKEVMRAIAKDTKAAAGGMKDTEKAAKGALAAFDDLNVLQKPDEATGAGAGGTAAGGFEYEMVPIDQQNEIVQWINETKENLKELWAEFKEDPWAFTVKYAKKGLEETGKLITEANNNYQGIRENAILIVKALWERFVNWVAENVCTPIVEFFEGLWETIKQLAFIAWEVIKEAWRNAPTWFAEQVEKIKSFFVRMWDSVKLWANNAWEKLKAIWGVASDWFKENVSDKIKEKFNEAMDGIKTKWETIWGGLKDFVKGTINGMIGFLNRMLSDMTYQLNTMIQLANSVGSAIAPNSYSPIALIQAPQIPKLASGAVIPPNSEFMAILGDQKSGRNIETPEALLRQIVQEELGNIQADISIGFTGSLGALVRELKPHIDRENVRVGGSLVKGGATL